MTILDKIADHARERVRHDREQLGAEEIRSLAEEGPPAESSRFYDAIAGPGLSFICEVKKASPSKGIIDPEFDYRRIAREYASAGADAISCLTEPKWFLGSDRIFREIRAEVKTPMLRKDFVVDAYQIYQAKLLGAECVLLICALLLQETICRFMGICEKLGLAALVETHNEEEIRSAVQAGARMIGVNNRNLKDFSVDLDNAARLRDLIPADRLFVAESGVKTPADAAALRASGADAILIGEALMRSADRGRFLKELREAAK